MRGAHARCVLLQKPDYADQGIIADLQHVYGIETAELTFLPLGADAGTAVYRAVATNGTPYFLKLRKGAFNPVTVEVPCFLHDQGLASVIAARWQPGRGSAGLPWMPTR